MMDIHKPKAAHSWREFLIEIGTIICGILIALGLEQGIEALHWRHIAEQSEEHLAAGLKADLVNSAEWVVIEPCMWDRATELVNELQKPGPSWKANVQPVPEIIRRKLPPLPMVFSAPGRIWPHVGWEAAVASGVLVHMPRERVDAYAEMYHLVDFAHERQNEIQLELSKLTPLGFDRNLSDAERTTFMAQLGEIQHAENGLINAGRQILRDAHAIGLEPDQRALEQRLYEEHRDRGACVKSLKLPLTPQ